jgi:predicted RNA-binding protein
MYKYMEDIGMGLSNGDLYMEDIGMGVSNGDLYMENIGMGVSNGDLYMEDNVSISITCSHSYVFHV